MVPEIFAFLGTDTARPDFEITTFIFIIDSKGWEIFFNKTQYQVRDVPF